ncbi:MAG TPA: methyltransferase domain-containing protein [Dehalococcoidia bacterium]|nr:methyltransferase domain-containing protein [Dehalococcoidia bacterium]
MVDSPFRPEHFARYDQAPDPEFYVEPRRVVHLDDAAIKAVGEAFRHHLPAGGEILDLMSSWRSHVPADLPLGRLIGLGLNRAEMEDNPQLDAVVIHDLNADPALPFPDASFDGAVVTVSVQYLTRPVEVFREVGRVLRPGAKFLVVYSNRMFPTKAVAIWQALDDNQRGQLVGYYFRLAGVFDEPTLEEWTPPSTGYTDPVYLAWAARSIERT